MRYATPKLFELNPKSVIKVYMIIRKISDFDIKHLKHYNLKGVFENTNYSLEEKYFLCLHLPQYLNFKNPKSHISKRIKEIEDLGDPKDIEVINDIKMHLEKITDLCKINLTKYKRRYDRFAKSAINLDNEEKKLNISHLNWNKLSIEKEFREDFLKFIYLELSPFYSENIIEAIIDNCFKISAFQENIKFLDIEYENSTEIYMVFRNIRLKYRDLNPKQLDIADTYKKKIIKEKDLLENTGKNSLKHKFIETKKLEGYNPSTLNFAIIMFITFSKVRENYILKNRSLENYLKSICKNL